MPYSQKFKQENSELIKAKQREANRRFREKHPERMKAAQKSWYDRNSEHSLAKNKEWRAKNPEGEFNSHLKRKYGLTRDQYDAMLAQQEGVCKICKAPPSGTSKGGKSQRLHVDHRSE